MRARRARVPVSGSREALRVELEVTIEVEARRGSPSRESAVFRNPVYLALAVGIHKHTPFAFGVMAPEDRIAGYTLNRRNPERSAERGIPFASVSDVAIQ